MYWDKPYEPRQVVVATVTSNPQPAVGPADKEQHLDTFQAGENTDKAGTSPIELGDDVEELASYMDSYRTSTSRSTSANSCDPAHNKKYINFSCTESDDGADQVVFGEPPQKQNENESPQQQHTAGPLVCGCENLLSNGPTPFRHEAAEATKA